MIRQEVGNGVGLIRRHREEVTEATSTEDDLFASAFRLEDRAIRVYLRCADAGHELTAGTNDEAIGFERSGTKICWDLRE